MGENQSTAPFAFFALLIICAILAAFALWQSVRLADASSSCASAISTLNSSLSSSQEKISTLENERASLQRGVSSRDAQLSSQKSQLLSRDAQISSLASKLESARADSAAKQIELEAEKSRLQNLSDQFSLLRDDINSSMSWFRENSAIPISYAWESDIIPSRISTSCADSSEVSLPCISHIFANTAIGISYKADIDNGSSDHLQSIVETVRRRGGDCEDYALFFKAALNSVRDLGNRTITAVEFGGGSEFIVYPMHPGRDESYEYYPNSMKRTIGNVASSHYYVVCYSLGYGGHCTVAVSPREIKSSDEIGMLNGAEVFEPQDGHYVGQIGRGLSICRRESKTDCFLHPGEIMIVISDSDLYSVFGGKWVGYSDFSSILDAASG